MKRLILTSLSIFFAQMLIAQVANFVVFAPEGQTFYLYLDGKLQNATPKKNIKVRYVPEGNYMVKAVLSTNSKHVASSSIMITAKKEISYIVEADADGWVFNHYSEVPIEQTNTVSSNQLMVEYTNKGLEHKQVKPIEEEPGEATAATNSDGVYTGGDLTGKREGEIKMVTYVAPDGTVKKVTQEEAQRLMKEANKTTTASTTNNEPETGSTETRAYKKEVHADGSVSIIEEVTTITKVIVEKDGQKMLKTKKQTMQYPTSFGCMPMEKDLHQALEMKITNAANTDRLELAKAGVKDQCLTSHQVKIIGNLLVEGTDRNSFAKFAKDFCADPKNYPYKVEDPVIVAKVDDPKKIDNGNTTTTTTTTTNGVGEPKVIEPEKELTAKEMKIKMKAELKLKKLKEKEEKKAAKLAAKEAKKKAKEAAKAAKLNAK